MTAYDVAMYIRDLLYQYEVVVLPDLGGFVTTYKPSSINYVEGKIQPPTKTLSFNENLLNNDNILINYIKNKHSISLQDATHVVQNFVNEIKVALNAGQSVNLPKIGKLSKTDLGGIGFEPENLSFDVDTYGLPDVDFEATQRKKIELEAAPPPVLISQKPKASWLPNFSLGSLGGGEGLQRFLPMAALAIGLLAIATYIIKKKPSTATPKVITETPVRTYEDEKVIPSSTTTTVTNEATHPEEETPNVNTATTHVNTAPTTSSYTDNTTSTNTTNTTDTAEPQEKTVVVVVDAFIDNDNAADKKKALAKAGYTTYSDKKGNYIRIGVRVPYTNATEKTSILNTIRKKYNKDAYILK